MTKHIGFPDPQDFARCLLSYGGPEEDPGAPEGGGRAGVSLTLRGAESGHPELLLIKRARHSGDPWSGQMALPGGRWEPGDRSLLATAIRETLEETGVRLPQRSLRSPAPSGDFLGCLPAVEPDSPHLPAITIVPFVFHVPPGTQAAARSTEVAATYWVRLDRFRHGAARASVRLTRSGTEYRFPAVRTAADEPVWGITYRVVMALMDRLEHRDPAR